VPDCCGCPVVDEDVVDVPADAAVVLDAVVLAVEAAFAVEAVELGPDPPVPAQAALLAVAMTIATVPTILVN
jgi:hypothetical protein